MTIEEMAKAYNVLLAAVVEAVDALEHLDYTGEHAADEAYQFLNMGLDATDAILNKRRIKLVQDGSD